MQKIVVYTDGGARGNPGPAAIAFEIYLENTVNKKIFSFGKKIGKATNNVAEYQAVIEALHWLINNQNTLSSTTEIHFFLDSNLVVNQLNGLFKTKNQDLINLLFTIKSLQQKLPCDIYYSYIPREKNQSADLLVNKALDN